MASSLNRRRLLSNAAAGLGLLLPAAASREATASVSSPPSLPQAGQTVSVSLYAFGATLVVNLPPPLPRLNLVGSRVMTIEIGGHDFVRERTLDFTMDAVHPLFGKVILQLPNIELSPGSILRFDPRGLVDTWVQPMTIRFDYCGNCEGPITFTTLEPVKLVAGHLTRFPPPPQKVNSQGSLIGGALYQLQSPANFGTSPPAIGIGTQDSSPTPSDPPHECDTCPLGQPLALHSTGAGDMGRVYCQLRQFNVNVGTLLA